MNTGLWIIQDKKDKRFWLNTKSSFVKVYVPKPFIRETPELPDFIFSEEEKDAFIERWINSNIAGDVEDIEIKMVYFNTNNTMIFLYTAIDKK